MTVLDRTHAAGDSGGVTGEWQECPDPEVPEKACRRTFTAQYRLDVVAEYDATATGERPRPRALAAAERQTILDMLHSERFAGTAPAEAGATLLDEGTYLGSVSTFYRVLRPAKAGNAADRPRIRLRSSPNSWRQGRTGSTPGTSPSCTARRNEPITTCT